MATRYHLDVIGAKFPLEFHKSAYSFTMKITILGTGLTESLLSASLSSHHQIIHVDTNDSYGSINTVHSIQSNNPSTISIFSKARCLVESTPSFILCSDPLTDIIRSSNIQNLEFILLDLYTTKGKVCGTKEELFTSSISLKQKRLLMRLLSIDKVPDFKGTFTEYLSIQGLEGDCSLMVHAIAQTDDYCIAMDRIAKYINSVGVYGPTGLMSGIYGTYSEITQAFCRYSAVRGTQFRLRFDITNVNGATLTGQSNDHDANIDQHLAQSREEKLDSDVIIVGPEYLQHFDGIVKKECKLMLITQTKRLETHGILVDGSFRVIQYGHESKMCPEDWYVIIVWRTSDLYNDMNLLREYVADWVGEKIEYYVDKWSGGAGGDNVHICKESSVSEAMRIYRLLSSEPFFSKDLDSLLTTSAT